MVGPDEPQSATAFSVWTPFVTSSPARKPARAFVKSYGCQMNVYDSGKIGALLAQDGIEASASPEDADVVVLNTCDIREKASEKVFSELGALRAWKQARRDAGASPVLVVAGCVAQAQGAEIIRRQSEVDVVVGPQAYHDLPALLARARTGERSVAADFDTSAKFNTLTALARRPEAARSISAFLTIQEGCDKFCTFCVVPYTRGGEVCRSPSSILAEAEALVGGGVRELVLLGQNVNAYAAEERGVQVDFATLIARLSDLPDLLRIRYTTSHPRDMADALLAAHRDNPKLMPFLHLPVQSGSDRILRAMNRKHTGDDYRRLIDRIKDARPDMAFSTDIIVGFPGESDADFAATCDLVRDVGYQSAYTFKYSIRPGTPAADLDNQVDEAVKHSRLLELQRLVDARRADRAREAVGRIAPVLFEKAGRNPGQIIGRTPWFGSIHAAGAADLIGTVRQVRLEAAGPNSHYGSLSESSEDPPL